ncbi:hypothetical protein GCM10023185_07190 [Hymenobacter saemangeumensis]|uniref:HTH cro/C1-type domain-containing protein n=1 Tax=Hymenobacter saemangeumensis TaxID=1084522 RepID=A0ABP8I2G8_9BACT
MPQKDTAAMKIKLLRKQAGLTQQDLAKKIGVSRAAISQFETGESKPSVETLVKLSSEFDVDVEDLLKSTDVSPRQRNATRIPIENLNLRVLPYLPIRARATFAESFADDTHKYNWEQAESMAVIDIPDTKEFTDALVVEVNGDSMEPTLRSGAKVVVTPVVQSNWQYLPSGIYCIIYNDSFVVKRVKNNTLLENGLLMLHSDNPEDGSFPVRGEDIRAIWRVRWAAYVPL